MTRGHPCRRPRRHRHALRRGHAPPDRGGRPTALDFLGAALVVPEELQAGPVWCVWKFEQRKGKWSKKPYFPGRGREVRFFPASADRPHQWVTMQNAVNAALNGSGEGVVGIGRLFTVDDPYCGIDLDCCLDEDGQLADWAAPIVASLTGAYLEISPSGTGLKAWCRAKLPGPGGKITGLGVGGRGAIEIYDMDRYFAVTGHAYGDPVAVVAERTEAVLELYGRIEAHRSRAAEPKTSPYPHHPPQPVVNGPSDLSDDELLNRARSAANGSKFVALYDRGDLSGHHGDASAADLALAAMLAYWTGGDAGRVERLFSNSALGCREKWVSRADYRKATIEKALASVTTYYDA